ncbi:MAG: AMP-binding protein [Desulfovibrionaceae bacterium]|nr:AMP-binding protein [Desulfovibrionaceae bacterium]
MTVSDTSLSEHLTLDELRALPVTIDGVRFDGDMRGVFIQRYLCHEGFLGDLARFLAEWRKPSPTLTVFTSGSTGEPQPMAVEKERMAASARATCQALGLTAGQTALLAMPMRYIAARMVVVRALLAGLNLLPVTPSSSPLREVRQHVDFAALTPMQAYTSLQEPETAERLREVRCLLLGGGAISAQLAKSLAVFPNEVWSSYGMTETLSHIALRRINGPSASEWFTTLPNVRVRLTEEGTLAIQAPKVVERELVTHDIAELDSHGRFRILGRSDNVINSGGIKVLIESVEELLEPVIRSPFCVTALPDSRLGERICLIHTGQESDESLEKICRHVLPKYWVPRTYLHAREIPMTETGKKARKQARRLAIELAGRL